MDVKGGERHPHDLCLKSYRENIILGVAVVIYMLDVFDLLLPCGCVQCKRQNTGH